MDQAAGWVDTHSHILPELDDGARSLDDALAMAAVAREDGIACIVATPHANFQFAYSHERVAASLARLRAALGDAGPALATGCELHLTFDNLQHALAAPRRYSLNGSRYLLVEFAEYFEPNAIGGVLGQMRQQGIVPVLAHPERNAVFHHHPEVLRDYLRLGCVSQLTAASFTGRFGRTAQEVSRAMLHDDLVHVVATDAHSVNGRPPRLQGAYEFIARHKNEEVAMAVCRDNPRAMAEDRELMYYPAVPARRKKSLLASLFGK